MAIRGFIGAPRPTSGGVRKKYGNLQQFSCDPCCDDYSDNGCGPCDCNCQPNGDLVEDECGACGGNGPEYVCWDGEIVCAAYQCSDDPPAENCTDFYCPPGEHCVTFGGFPHCVPDGGPAPPKRKRIWW